MHIEPGRWRRWQEKAEDDAKKELRKVQRELRTLASEHEDLQATLASTKQTLERLRARRGVAGDAAA